MRDGCASCWCAAPLPLTAALHHPGPLRPDDEFALFIMHERRKGVASAHAQHIDSIPKVYDQTIFWSGRSAAPPVLLPPRSGPPPPPPTPLSLFFRPARRAPK